MALEIAPLDQIEELWGEGLLGIVEDLRHL
jgi:hypothetical protein